MKTAATRPTSPEPAGPEPWHTPAETRAHLGVSADTLDRLVRDGLPCLDVGHHDPRRRRKRALRFRLGDVEAWLRERGSR